MTRITRRMFDLQMASQPYSGTGVISLLQELALGL
jgi:hypothetical protein